MPLFQFPITLFYSEMKAKKKHKQYSYMRITRELVRDEEMKEEEEKNVDTKKMCIIQRNHITVYHRLSVFTVTHVLSLLHVAENICA